MPPFLREGRKRGEEKKGGEGRSPAAQRTDGRSQLGREDTKKWERERERENEGVHFRSFSFFWLLAACEWIFVEESREDSERDHRCVIRWTGEGGGVALTVEPVLSPHKRPRSSPRSVAFPFSTFTDRFAAMNFESSVPAAGQRL